MPIFHTDHEIRTYQALRRLVQNHITVHALSLTDVYVSLIGNVGDLGLQLRSAGIDVRRYHLDCCVLLHELAREQGDIDGLSSGELPLDAEELQTKAAQQLAVFNAIGDWCAEASAEQGLELSGGVRIVLTLLGDVLHALQHALDWEPAEVATFIDETMGPSIRDYLTTNAPYTTHAMRPRP